MSSSTLLDLPLAQGKRHVLQAEEELRVEIPFSKSSTTKLILQKGSCELQGVELALHKTYTLMDGGFHLALFTWHGCVIDVDSTNVDMDYISDEIHANVAYVNTHAQLEVLRDEAFQQQNISGPRVLIVGQKESGKSSLARILTAYATKLGRTPLLVDLDPHDNTISISGTLSVCPMNRDVLSVESFAANALPSATAPLTFWHGNTQISPAVWKQQVTAMGHIIEARMQHDSWTNSSGIIVNTNGWVQDEQGFQMIQHAIEQLKVSVVLVLGHDRLYSMLQKNYKEQQPNMKIIKLPRSGGVVARQENFMRQVLSRSIGRYFHGDAIEQTTSGSATPQRVPSLTPFLLQISIDKIKVLKYSELNLSASLLPVAAAQTTEALSLLETPVTEQLIHAVLAVCHPQAVQKKSSEHDVTTG